MEKIKLIYSNTFTYFGANAPTGGGETINNTSDCPHKISNVIACDASGGGSIWNIIAIGINLLAVGVGVAVLLGIIFGAFMYTTSAGSAAQAEKGITYIKNAVIALLLFAFMWAIINFVIPGGLF